MSEIQNPLSIIPISGFSSEVDSIKLNEKICIRSISPSELEKLLTLFSMYKDDLRYALDDVEYVIERKWEPGEAVDWHEGSLWVNNIILALRLLKKGSLDIPTAFLLGPRSRAVSNTAPRIGIGEPTFILKKKEIAKFRKLWEKLQNLKKEKPHLEFSVEQFSRAFEENTGEDAVVDYMIAFESLVFYGEDKTFEGGKVVGIAIGMLIGKNQKERNEIKNDLINAYKLRNYKVHGNIKKLNSFRDKFLQTRPDFSFEVEEYLRRTLRKLVEE